MAADCQSNSGGNSIMIIVKIGGGNSINLPGIASDLADIHEPMLIVHGRFADHQGQACSAG